MTKTANLPAPLEAAPLVSNWVAFSATGRLRVRSGRVELGQGNTTALLQMAADELDVDIDQIDFVMGDTRETPNEGFTSGSQSISSGGVALRMAASAARALLVAEAAKLLQVQPEVLGVSRGVIQRDGADTDLSYWSLAGDVALDVDVVEHAAPKAARDRLVAGRNLARIDLAERIEGAPFVHDLVLPNMLHGRPIHAPSLRAALESIDAVGLRSRPGVIEVVRDGSFLGVIAEHEADAIAAAEWGRQHARWASEAGAPDDAVAAIRTSQEDVEIVHSSGNMPSDVGRDISTTVTRPYLSHASIGPSCAVARWDAGRLTVWSQTQGVYPLQRALADVFGLEADAIDVIHMNGSGCYGHNGADDVALDAALLARAVVSRPVRVVWSRADEFMMAPLGPAMATQAKATIGTDNRIIAMRVMANSAPHGNRPGRNGAPNLRASAYLASPFPIPRSSDVPPHRGGGTDRNSVPLYDIPNLEIAKRVVHALPYRSSSLRGLGAFVNVYAIETLMDDVAIEIDCDPLSCRMNHLTDERARNVLEMTAQACGWPAKAEANAGVGLGLARYKNSAAYCAVAARVEVTDEVRLTHVWAHVDCGEVINPDGVINQIEGGIVQSASWTLKEQIRFEGAVVASDSWEAYPILKFSEIPEIHVALTPRAELPPLGCAEAAQGPTAAAIGNAVRSALGVRVRDLPLTRDAILAAIDAAV